MSSVSLSTVATSVAACLALSVPRVVTVDWASLATRAASAFLVVPAVGPESGIQASSVFDDWSQFCPTVEDIFGEAE